MTWVLGDRLSCWMKESVSVDLASWRRCSVAIGMVMGVEVELIQRRVMEGFREVDYSGVFEIKVALEALEYFVGWVTSLRRKLRGDAEAHWNRG